MGRGFLLGVRKMFWNQILLIGVEPCGYTKNTELYICLELYIFKCWSFMLCELYLNLEK